MSDTNRGAPAHICPSCKMHRLICTRIQQNEWEHGDPVPSRRAICQKGCKSVFFEFADGGERRLANVTNRPEATWIEVFADALQELRTSA